MQDYTVQYWFDHLLDCIKSLDPISERDKCQDVFSLAMVFLKSYGQRDKMDELHQAETYTQLADAITEHLLTHSQKRNFCFSIDIRTESLRQKIAKLDFKAFTAEEQKVFGNLHGPRTAYKCSKPWCDFFKGGLGTQTDRQKHIDEYEYPYRCAYQDCMVGFELGFSTEDELQNHNGKWHAQKDDANSFPPAFPSWKSHPAFLKISARTASIKRVKEATPRVRQLLEFYEGIKDIDTGIWPRRVGVYRDIYPLGVAAEMGHKEICDLLISNGASIDIGEGTALRAAEEGVHLEVCKPLISKGATVDIGQTTPLQAAVSGAHYYPEGYNLEVCKFLISKGATVTGSAFMSVVLSKRLQISQVLIQEGADINFVFGSHKPQIS